MDLSCRNNKQDKILKVSDAVEGASVTRVGYDTALRKWKMQMNLTRTFPV